MRSLSFHDTIIRIILHVVYHNYVLRQVPDGDSDQDAERKGNVTYGIDDIPSWYLCIFMALQVSR